MARIMTATAFTGDYTDLRFVKGRKVCQVVVEIPIEAGAAFVAAFGAPDPSKSCPVALAKLEPSVLRQQLEASEKLTRPKGGKLAQRAGILCGEPAFRAYLLERRGFACAAPTVAAEFVRRACNVESRAELDHNPEAARKFNDLVAEYEAWRLVA